MKILKIIIVLIMMFLINHSAIAQNVQYKVRGHTSDISIGSADEKGVMIYSRVQQPITGITANSYATLVSGGKLCNNSGSELIAGNKFTIPTGDEGVLPDEFTIYSNYPNPFNPSTTIKYYLPETQKVLIKVYKILGQEVCTLVNEQQSSGEKSVEWNGRNSSGQIVGSGVYICRFVAGEYSKSIKMLLMK